MIADPIEIAHRYLVQVWEERDLEVLDSVADPHIVLRDPLTFAEGRCELAAHLRRAATSFSDVSIVIDDIALSAAALAQGAPADDLAAARRVRAHTTERVVISYMWRARHAGPFLAAAATDRRVVLEVVDVIHVSRGRVVEHDSHYDLYALLQQLELVPSPEQLVRRPAPVLRLVPATNS